jgi:DNA-directed RNA polymerase specialized sigma24 family protein
MTDSTSDEDRDDFILQERLSGRSVRSIGKQLSLTVGEVNASLDRTLPKIDNAARVRHISLDLISAR